jgi:uncharacterized protein (TIGR02145 family)
MKKFYAFLTTIALLLSCAIKAQITVDLEVYLEGPYFSGALTPWLNGWGYLPLDHPYDASPWFYYGPEAVTAIPNADVVDWVLVELRQTTGPASTANQDSAIARQVGFIMEDGSIVGMDGSSPLQFNVSVTSNLYAVVMTRNHLSIMSGYPLQLSGGVYAYDFTTAADKVYGGVNGHKQIAGGVWAMVSGDGDSNGNVNNADKIDVWKPQSGNSGYLNGDFNMNGQVDNVDKNEYWKPNSGRSSQVPGGSPNTPPTAVIQVNPPTGTTITLFTMDASASYDAQSKPALMAARWDFENDGTWDTPYSTTKSITHQYLTAGDYIIKVEVIDVSGLTDTETCNLQVGPSFGTPCPGIPTVTYEGQVYNTVQIGTQCWLKENLNVGTMITGSQNQTNNQVIEKYCFNDDTANCTTYGGLYHWDEMMQYVTTPGTKGICPDGWHLPTDAELCILEQFVDTTITCNSVDWRGVDGGDKLKETDTAHWSPPNTGATNSVGFTALPGGYMYPGNNFSLIALAAGFWSSSEVSGTNAWIRRLYYDYAQVDRSLPGKDFGMSVRCVKNTPPSWSCGDTIVDARDGQVYNTVEIGTQCWMQENLNIGNMIPGANDMTNNGVIEKYCYENSTANCDVYGGLYQWDEMMQYANTPGIKGICPDGWHLPTDVEWCTLEQYVDPTITCSSTGWRGVDGGGKLKEAGTEHWAPPNTGATNSSGFTGIPGGDRSYSGGSFSSLTFYGYFWSSSESGSNVWYRYLVYSNAQVYRNTNDHKSNGLSVRCVQGPQPSWSCGDTIVDARDGQVYNTVEIGTQCWMQGNLNIGIMLSGSDNPSNNMIIEKFCYEDNSANCEIYGGMYQWNEMMDYNYQPGKKGICTSGWHLPTDDELKILEGAVDSQYGVGNPVWNQVGVRGFDAGGNLKESGYTHWQSPNTGATNSSGYTLLPGGEGRPFIQMGYAANIWSSSDYDWDEAWYRSIYYNLSGVIRGTIYKSNYTFSVRCVKDTSPPTWSCGDTIVDARDGQVYNTVEIGTQCWMQENLNMGTMIQGTSNQIDNGTIEKYCYDNNTANCDVYGGLYQWDEMMQYVTTPGVKGICPDGWHLPTDAEWCTLTQYIDPTVSCGVTGWSGTDVGTKMKSTTGWYGGGNGTNTSGFTALPGGLRYASGFFNDLTLIGSFWSSTEYPSYNAWGRDLNFSYATINRYYDYKTYGFSVRCIKDPSWSCGDTIIDARDGQIYNTVHIGTQCWMQENLNIGAMIQGTSDQTNNGTIEKYCYNNSTTNCDEYGGLYQWNEMMQYTTQQGTRGICPEGWHVPADAEWLILSDFLGGSSISGGAMKEAGTVHWFPPNTGATNISGFTALPGGYRYVSGGFDDTGHFGYFWLSTEYSSLSSFRSYLLYNNAGLFVDWNQKVDGFSVRCLKDYGTP